MRRPGREVPAGARRDPAAERRELERLRVEAHRQAVPGELLLEARPARAGLDARGARDRGRPRARGPAAPRSSADRALRDRAPGQRVDAADDARARRRTGMTATSRSSAHHSSTSASSASSPGARDARRADAGTRPRSAAHDVEVRAPVGVAHALAVSLACDALSSARRHRTCGTVSRTVQSHRLLGLGRAEPEVLGQPRRGRAQLVRRRLLVLVAPAPVVATPHLPSLAECPTRPGILARGPWERRPGRRSAGARTRSSRRPSRPRPPTAAIAALAGPRLARARRARRAARRLRGRRRRAASSSCSRCAGRCGCVRGRRRARCRCCASCATPTGRWLAGRRAAWVATWAGRWALGAGGAVEVGEDPVETLARELAGGVVGRARAARGRGAGRRCPTGMAMLVGQAWLPAGAEVVARPRARRARLVAAPTPRAWPEEADPRCARMATLLA